MRAPRRLASMIPAGGYQPNPRASEGAIDADILGMEARQAEQDRENALRRPSVDRADGRTGKLRAQLLAVRWGKHRTGE